MAKEKEKVKQFAVTQSLRFQNPPVKYFYYFAVAVLAIAVISLAVCLITHTKGVIMGVSAIAGFLGLIWVFAVHFISENAFGLGRISFLRDYIVYTCVEEKSRMAWDKVVECGIEKTRRAFWVYASDHALTPAEKKEFPENVGEGVYYFNYYFNTWDEFMLYVPEQFKPALEARKNALGIK